MAKWSRELILDNISYIINKNGLAIKEAEIASGVSVGYIARMKKGSEKISAEFIVRFADYVNVSLDLLISEDLTQIQEQKQFACNFLTKLLSSVAVKEWKEIAVDWSLSYNHEHDISVSSKDFESLPQPFFKEVENIDSDYKTINYNSLYCPDKLYSSLSSIFTLKIDDKTYIALTQAIYEDKAEYELYMVTANTPKAICHTGDNPFISESLKSLYDAIKTKLNPLQLTVNDMQVLNSIF